MDPVSRNSSGFVMEPFSNSISAQNPPQNELLRPARDVPGGPVVNTSCSTAGGMGSSPGRRTRIPCATGLGQKTKGINQFFKDLLELCLSKAWALQEERHNKKVSQ